jgi:aminotransferase
MHKAAGIRDVISLGLSDPDLPTPAHIVEAAKRAIDSGSCDVIADPTGLPRLRVAVAEKLWHENSVAVSPNEVVITTGGQEGLFLALQSILRPGDEVLVPDPRYLSYDTAIHMAGAQVVSVPTYESDAFDLDPAAVEARVTPRTRMLLLASPCNPTGGTISPDRVRQLATIARRHDLMVVSNEMYEKLLYDDAKHLSIASLPGMADRTITVNSFSKAYCMAGWRVGWLAGPERLVREAARLKRLTSASAPLVSQYAAVAALAGPQEVIRSYLEQYSRRRRIVLDALDRIGFTYGKPRGGLFVFLNASASGIGAEQLSHKLLSEARVLIFPGTGFGARWSKYLRIAWLAPEKPIVDAMARVERCLSALSKGGR